MSSKAFYMAMVVIVVTISLVFSSAMGFEMMSDNQKVGILMGIVGGAMLLASLGGFFRSRQLR